MFITPINTLLILQNVPLDPSYEHTLYWDNPTTQENYFRTKIKHDLDDLTFIRQSKGKIKVEVSIGDLYDCNYIMFRNNNPAGTDVHFGYKWFYAFITDVEYVNNKTSEITFQIDIMQTWFFEHTLEMCLVEREHAETDEIGDNLVPENLELGEYMYTTQGIANDLYTTSIVIASTVKQEPDIIPHVYTDYYGGRYSGLFTGLYYTAFPNTEQGVEDAIDFIQGASKHEGSIVSVFAMPTAFITDEGDPVAVKTLSKDKEYSLGGTYQIKNNKLYTYPYNFLYVTNNQGTSATYPYEFFITSSCGFSLLCDMSPNPTVILAPSNYKGIAGVNLDEKITLSGYPQFPFNTDLFKAWLAQNSTNLAVNAMGIGLGVANSVARAQMGNVGGAVTGLINSGMQAAHLLGEVHAHAVMPPQAHSGAGSITLLSAGLLNFSFYNKHIRPEFVKIIDGYFSMYGYATHQLKKPNLHSRSCWNYIKTSSAVITSTMPSDDAEALKRIYDNGITFWHTHDKVGDYTQDNAIL